MPSIPPAQQSRFKTATSLTTQERLSTNTVGLVALSDFRKRRAEVLEQQEREAREALRTSDTPRAGCDTPATEKEGDFGVEKKAKRRKKKTLVSFGDQVEEGEDEDEGAGDAAAAAAAEVTPKNKRKAPSRDEDVDMSGMVHGDCMIPAKVKVNAAVDVVPRALTKAALRREAAQREALRKEFLVLQEAVKSTDIAVPFVFYDGTNIPGGTVRVRKGEFVWVFLDKSRKVGAERGVGGGRKWHARRAWARVGVDDLLLVRGTVIIPHHYEFYFFIMNQTVGPGNVRLFNYSAEVPPLSSANLPSGGKIGENLPASALSKGGISRKDLVDIKLLEGANDDPSFTKVVDRRWYERNKHIYPASMWQEFDPEKDYTKEVRKDTGGNTFFFSK